MINGILNLNPAQISYVSCDPATLARDLKKLIAGGYIIQSILAFDLFPQTHHVETVVRLSVNYDDNESSQTDSISSRATIRGPIRGNLRIK